MTADRRRMSRSRILSGATEILDEGVYGDLTVDALARALHMSKSTLYKYFPSKEDVIICLVDTACTTTEREIDQLDLNAGTARQALNRLVEVQAQHADRLPRATVLQHTRLPAGCQDRIEVTNARIASAFRDVMARGAQTGEFRFSSPVLAATAFMASAQECMKTAARGEFAGTRGDSVRALLDLFVPGLTQGELAGV
jgi:AcrR family transcriptional regulator